MTRITDWKSPCIYIHVYQRIKNWGPGPYNSVRHTDKKKYFSGLSLTWNRRKAHLFYLTRKVEIIWICSCWEKSNFFMVDEFKYGQIWKMWRSTLSLLLCSTFKALYELLTLFSLACASLGMIQNALTSSQRQTYQSIAPSALKVTT